MILRPTDLERHLTTKLAPLYLVHGDAPLLVLEAADQIRAAAREQGYQERETLVAGQGFRWDTLFMASGNLSLFGSHKLIDLRIPTGKPGRDGAEALQRYASRLPESTLTLITLPEVDWNARKSVWFKTLEQSGQCLEMNAPPRERLPDWIAARLGRQQQRTDREALQFIADHVEGNLLAAHQEILKLGLLHPPGQLAFESVRDAVLDVARYDIDALRAAMLEGDCARCNRILEGLRAEAAAPPLILWVIANELRTLLQVRMALDQGQAVAIALKNARIYDDSRRRAMQRALPQLSIGLLSTALLHAARVDRVAKGVGDGGDVWEELLMLSLRIAKPLRVR